MSRDGSGGSGAAGASSGASSGGGASSSGGGSSGGSGRRTLPSAGAWSPGTVIAGRYVIESLIASGGMSRVYLAIQRPLGRQVALKALVPLEHDPEFRQRFLLEASVCAQLEHPAIVTVHDYGEAEDGALFMATEYLRGHSLAAAISQGGPFTPARAVRVASGIARALRAAHRAGLVHRDLKPGNVMVVPDEEAEGRERVKVLDFGLVKLFDRTDDPNAPQLTVEGMMVGSPRFMAPEQITGAPVDPRTDVYALGTVLYLLLDGRPPFTAPSPAEVLKMHLETPPAPFTRAVSPALEALVMRCLAKRPDDRFGSMDEVIAALDRLRDDTAAAAGALEAAPSFMAPDEITTAQPRPPHDASGRGAVALADPTQLTAPPDLEQGGWAALFGEPSSVQPRDARADAVGPRAVPSLALPPEGEASTAVDTTLAVPVDDRAVPAAQVPGADAARAASPTPQVPAAVRAPATAAALDPALAASSAPALGALVPRAGPDPTLALPSTAAPASGPLSLALPRPSDPKVTREGRDGRGTARAPTSAPPGGPRAAAPPDGRARAVRLTLAAIALAALATLALAALDRPSSAPLLRLSSEPVGALVLLDGQPIGFTPLDQLLDGDQRDRTVTVTFEREGYAPALRTVALDRDVVDVAVALEHARVPEVVPTRVPIGETGTASTAGPMITVISRPAGARVWIDGANVGATPYVSALAPGTTRCHVRVVGEGDSWEGEVTPNVAGHFAVTAELGAGAAPER